MPELLLFTSPRMLEHRPPVGHPESPARLAAILEALERTATPNRRTIVDPPPADASDLARIHPEAYLHWLAEAEKSGARQIESDTWLSTGSLEAASLAAGAAMQAVDRVLQGDTKRAFCAIRPPGHHALRSRPMGFCIYANIAIAAQHALERHALDRVLIIDFDVHHGNGTQDIFYAEPRVGFVSLHRHPFYPGTGMRDETGTGPGLGTTLNVPLVRDSSPRAYHDEFQKAAEAMAARIRPQLVLISAGFDAHVLDPVGNLNLEAEDFDRITRAIVDIANVHAEGRVVSLLEGGYNVPKLVECVTTHLTALEANARAGR